MTLGVGLVGCGRIAKKHAEILAGDSVEGATLQAVCDIREDRLNDLSKKYKVTPHKDLHQLAQDPKVDIISVLTESGNHAKHVIELEIGRAHV